MPRVQTYQPNQIQATHTNAPRARNLQGRVTPIDVSGIKGIADGFKTYAREQEKLDDEYAVLQDREATTQAEQALNTLNGKNNDYLFKGRDAYFNTKGERAYQGGTAARESLKAIQKELSDSLSPEAQLKFNRAADARSVQTSKSISRHEFAGLQQFEQGTMKAGLENSIETVGLYWNDPEKVTAEMISGESNVRDLGKMQGKGAEEITEDVETFRHSMAASAMDASLLGTPAEAQDTLNRYGDELEGKAKAQYQAKIDKLVDANNQINESAYIAGIAFKIVSRNHSYEDMRDVVIAMYGNDPRYKKIMSAVNAEYSNKKAVETERKLNASEDFLNTAQAKPGGAEEWLSNNPDKFYLLSPTERDNAIKGKYTVTDQKVWNDFQALEPDDQSKVDLSTYRHKLSPDDLKTARTMQKDARSGKSDPQIESVAKYKNRRVEETIRFNEEPHELYNDIQLAQDGWIKENETTPSPRQSKEIIDNTLRTFIIERDWDKGDFPFFDTEVERGDVPPEHLYALNSVEGDKEMIYKAYKQLVKEGYQITPDYIRAAVLRLN